VNRLEGSLGVITGASGFIGRALVQALPRTAVVYATYLTDDTFPSWVETCAADVRPIRIDLARKRVADAIGEAVDWAILLAARVELLASRRDPVDELVAVAGPATNAVIGLQARHILHLSSGSVYETLTGRLDPERVLSPRLPYSVAKLSAEFLVSSIAEAPVQTVRFFGAYGPGEPDFKLTRRLVDAFRGGATEFVLSGDGGNRIDPMHVEDAAAFLLDLTASSGEGILDLCQGERYTIREYAQVAYEAVHPNPSSKPLSLQFEGEAHEQMRGYADPSRADAIVKKRRRTLREGFRDYAGWLTERQS
jgi:nucleoside-diphosphate-sugar epimerase